MTLLITNLVQFTACFVLDDSFSMFFFELRRAFLPCISSTLTTSVYYAALTELPLATVAAVLIGRHDSFSLSLQDWQLCVELGIVRCLSFGRSRLSIVRCARSGRNLLNRAVWLVAMIWITVCMQDRMCHEWSVTEKGIEKRVIRPYKYPVKYLGKPTEQNTSSKGSLFVSKSAHKTKRRYPSWSRWS